jgi:hypothetical protein
VIPKLLQTSTLFLNPFLRWQIFANGKVAKMNSKYFLIQATLKVCVAAKNDFSSATKPKNLASLSWSINPLSQPKWCYV